MFRNVLYRLMLMPEKVEDNCMEVIERFVVMLYDQTSANSGSKSSKERSFLKEG